MQPHKQLLDDPYLAPYAETIKARAERVDKRQQELVGVENRRKFANAQEALVDWARAHEYYGLHRVADGWVFREWAPNATEVWLVGDFSAWQLQDNFKLVRVSESGDWEGKFPAEAIHHGDYYRLEIRWFGGRGERIPAYARYVVQDANSHLFCARVWEPVQPYQWQNKAPTISKNVLIYEAHVGMAQEAGKVSSYTEFRDLMLPRIKKCGYNTVQLMAVMEHPYYGSFGYHVSSFFAPCSRFGTPDELKSLVDTAHGMGLRVIMDIVHSHAVKNERDGLSKFDGTPYQYFHAGEKGWHSAWGSRCFDYHKPEVIRFLLSNCRYWLEEFHFDGFRFDGVTSMLYWDHGLGRVFSGYSNYFDGSLDEDAWCYLSLANTVIHAVNKHAITIAEDVSGVPGCASPRSEGGMGFDYRLAMGEPDYWFRLVSDIRDENWNMSEMFRALTDKRSEEKVIAYVESHDQALVGGKSFFFQMVDKAIYNNMGINQQNVVVDRGIALHKMARLVTAALSGGGYLNFMGNEFGHPEWIDFPREENGWSFAHARRQWSLRDNSELRFKALGDFDEALMKFLHQVFDKKSRGNDWTNNADDIALLRVQNHDKILAFARLGYLWVFNFNPSRSFADYPIIVPPGWHFKVVFNTDEECFGGYGRIPAGLRLGSWSRVVGKELIDEVFLYIPARSAIVLKFLR